MMTQWQKLCANAEKLHLDRNEFEKLGDFFDSLDPVFFHELKDKAIPQFPLAELQKKYSENDLGKLLFLCVVSYYGHAEEYYADFPPVMLEEISHDLRIWENTLFRDYGCYAIPWRIFTWERGCFTGGIKQCGRLQFNDVHYFDPDLSVFKNADGSIKVVPGVQENADLKHGDKCVNLHIPASGPLTKEACLDSIRKIRAFMKTYHIEYKYKAFVCYSWILDPQFRTILKEGANILEFQKLGHLFTREGHEESQEILWRLWGNAGKSTPLEKLPCRTSLEKGVVRFLQSGGHFQEGCMILFEDEVDSL